MTNNADIPIADMLNDFGIIDKTAQQTARKALFQSHVIQKNSDRPNISCSKVDPAQQALREQFIWHCNHGNCRTAAQQNPGKPPLPVEQRACQICHGSPSAKALLEMEKVAIDDRKSNILIVGGTEKKEREILKKLSSNAEWRFIDGTKGKEDRYYRSHRDWADIIVIWQSTPLGHRVSAHFDGKGDRRVITVRRRGIHCLAEEIIRHCQAM